MLLGSLKGDYAFRRLQKGQAGYSKYLSVRWRGDQEGRIRVGIIVTKKLGKAVKRNLVRRRLLEALRALLREVNFMQGALFKKMPSFSLLIIARPEAVQATYKELEQSLRHALIRAKLIQ
ncbi:MAG: ribonuclease P protein component [Trueperaceae bacterium]|nr:ribonuclease P protein component [Trueperaceae bacterium]